MADAHKVPDAVAPLAQHGRDLQHVNDRLKDLIDQLRTSRDRSGCPAAAPAQTPLQHGDAIDLEKRRLAAELVLAREAAASAEDERERIRERLAEIEAENRRISDEYVSIQEHATELAQRCAALEALHGGTSRVETLAALQEIVINLVGSEEVVVLERRGDDLVPVHAFGVDPTALGEVRAGRGAIGRAVSSGQAYVPERGWPLAPGEEDLTAAIPLRVGREVTGAIAVFRLLAHKPCIGEADHALFELLSRHAGLALRSRTNDGAARAS